MKGLYSGSQIVSLKSRSQKITRSQTASQAYNAILKKYGSIKPHAHYFHVGKGIWHEWSMERDKQRTGKLASTKLEWAERPNKFDWQGIDTKEGSKKRAYSVTSIKHPSKLSGRKSKSAPKFVGEHVTKEIKRPKFTLSAIKSPTKPSNRKEKVQLKGSGKGVLKHVEVKNSMPKKRQIPDTSNKWKGVLKHPVVDINMLNTLEGVLTDLLRNVKITKRYRADKPAIVVESAYPEQAYTAVKTSLESGYNDAHILMKKIGNTIIYKGMTVVVIKNNGLSVKKINGEYKNYKYAIIPEKGIIEYFANNGKLKGYDDEFNINLESVSDLKALAIQQIDEHTKLKWNIAPLAKTASTPKGKRKSGIEQRKNYVVRLISRGTGDEKFIKCSAPNKADVKGVLGFSTSAKTVNGYIFGGAFTPDEYCVNLWNTGGNKYRTNDMKYRGTAWKKLPDEVRGLYAGSMLANLPSKF